MKYFISLSFILFSTFLEAQIKSTYLDDISNLKEILEKAPSFKDQIKGHKLADFNNLFHNLKSDSVESILSNQYFLNLAQLFFPIRDNHLSFYQTLNENNYKDISTYNEYFKSDEFIISPTYNINLDSLQKELSNKPMDSIEGIYYLDTLLTVGLFKAKSNEYIGVVLASKILIYGNAIWKPGQIAIYLFEYLPNYFKAVYADPTLKRLILYPNEKFKNSSLINSHFYGHFNNHVYSKITSNKDFVNLPKNTSAFIFKNINFQIQYLGIKHFSASNTDIQKSNSFYDSIKNLITAPNLILDLRNNDGGAEKVSKKYFKLIKKYSKNGKVYVLVNNSTISQGEIFTLQLKKLKNVQIFGQATRGNLMYGNNYGKRVTLPSKSFEVYITDMKGKKELAPYEVFGVEPDHLLSNYKDWVDQLINKIEND